MSRPKKTPETEVKTAVVAEVAHTPDAPAESATEPAPESAAPPSEPPDHLVHRVSLDEYAKLRGLNPFQAAILTRATGTYDRPFDAWEDVRQSVIGG